MKASELIEKIHNNEIREGTKIICHKKNEYFDYEFTRYFMGNWFSKVPAEQHTSDDDFDKDMILELCDRSVTYRIVDESELNECLSQQKKFINYLEKEIVDCKAGSGQQYYAQEHLKMFKEIIGGNKDEFKRI